MGESLIQNFIKSRTENIIIPGNARNRIYIPLRAVIYASRYISC